MRSPAERRLAYQAELVRARRLGAGIRLDETWSERLRARWPSRLRCEMSCGPGWSDLIEAVNELIDQEAVEKFTFSQIKEKFAGLRMYWYGEDPSGLIDQTIDAAEEISQSLCETCGSVHGKVWNRHGYVYTACDEHARPGSSIARVKTERIRTVGFRIRSTKIEDGEDS